MKTHGDDALSTPVPFSVTTKQHWRHFVLLLIPVLTIAALYWQSVRDFVALWNDVDRVTYSHGWMIAAICLWLLYRESRRFKELKVTPDVQGAAMLFVMSAAWLVASRVNIQVAQLLLMPVLCWSSLWAVYGLQVAKRCAFACAYLLFAVPVWDFLTPLLQWGTVFAVRAMVRVVGIPAFFDANTIHLPAGAIVVEGGCSGLNFFVAGMALVILYGHVGNVVQRYKLWGLGMALMVIDNWLRVFLILLAGHLTDMQHYLVRVEHLRFGYAMFAVVMVLFFFVASRMNSGEDKADTQIAVQPKYSLRPLYAVLVCLSVISVPAWAGVIELRESPRLLPWPSMGSTAGWAQSDNLSGVWQPAFSNADAQSLLHFRRGDSAVDAFQAAFVEQHQDKKLAGYGNTVLGSLVTTETLPPSEALPQFVVVDATDAHGGHHLVAYSYYVGDRWFQSPIYAQIWSGLMSLFWQPVSGVVALHSTCAGDCSSALISVTEVARKLPLGPPPTDNGAP